MADFPIAVAGAGVIGRSHIERILRTPGFRLVGVAEPGEAGRRWCQERQLPLFDDPAALLQQARPAGLVVATPNATHLEVASLALTAGVPALVEKPVTDTPEAGLRLVELAERTGVPVLVGHHRRHNPILQRARRWVEEGRLGRVVNGTVMANIHKPAAYYDVPWRRQAGGGPVLINLIHDIDMLLFLLGEVAAVQAATGRAVRGLPVEDTAAAVFEFRGGALVTLVTSDTATSPWNWDLCAGEQPQYPRQAAQTHFLSGTLGSLSLPDLALWRYDGEPHWHHELTREQTAVHAQDAFAGQLLHFREVAQGRQAPLCSALDGWRALQAAMAMHDSARLGRRVELEPAAAGRKD